MNVGFMFTVFPSSTNLCVLHRVYQDSDEYPFDTRLLHENILGLGGDILQSILWPLF
jgi:hypothetical protein